MRIVGVSYVYRIIFGRSSYENHMNTHTLYVYNMKQYTCDSHMTIP